jgi:hypothetical protein
VTAVSSRRELSLDQPVGGKPTSALASW